MTLTPPSSRGPAGFAYPFLKPNDAASAAATNLAVDTFGPASDPNYRALLPLAEYTTVRILGRLGGSLVATTKIGVQFTPSQDPALASGDGSWTLLGASAGGHTLDTLFLSDAIAIPAAALLPLCQLRVGPYSGDGAADPTLSCCVLFFA